MEERVQQFRAFVGLRNGVAEDFVAQRADCLEVKRLLGEELIEVFLLQLIGNHKLRTHHCQVRAAAKQQSSETKDVGRDAELIVARILVDRS